MAIRELLTALERDAAAEATAIVTAARAEADRRIAAAAGARATRHAGALADARAVHQGRLDATHAEAERRGRAQVLTARAAALARLHDAVAAELPTALDDAVLAALVAALVDVAGDGAAVRCAPALVPRVRACLADRPGFTVAADPAVTTGVMATRADGQVEIDATLATALARLWPRLRLEVTP